MVLGPVEGVGRGILFLQGGALDLRAWGCGMCWLREFRVEALGLRRVASFDCF